MKKDQVKAIVKEKLAAKLKSKMADINKFNTKLDIMEGNK